MKLHSYPKLWNWPHAQVETILDGEVVIQEKYDGSQFSFGVRGGGLHFRSRSVDILPDTTDKIFAATVRHVAARRDKLPEGYTFRGEAFRGPKHNTKTYGDTPAGNLVLFDVEEIPGKFLSPKEVRSWAEQLNVETARTIFEGSFSSAHPHGLAGAVWLEGLLGEESTLGGTRLEGVVIKAYNKLNKLGQVMMAKLVSAEFKEQHKKNPEFKRGKEYAITIADNLRTEPRWRKAVSHLRDRGGLEGSPRDIGPLLRELQEDTEQECADDIARQLWLHYRKTILKGIGRGFPEWYKAELRRSTARSGGESQDAIDEASGESVFIENTGGETATEGGCS